MRLDQERLTYLRSRCRRYPKWLPAKFRERVRTIFPYFVLPDWVFDTIWEPRWDDLLAHEGEHLTQQSSGARWVPVILRLLWWLVADYTRKGKRLEIEAVGIAAEIEQAEEWERRRIWDCYLDELTGESYGYAARDKHEAAQAIRLALVARGCSWAPGVQA